MHVYIQDIREIKKNGLEVKNLKYVIAYGTYKSHMLGIYYYKILYVT